MSSAEAEVQSVEKAESWSDWQLETAIRMWTASQSSTEIAKVVGRTRNAVIGRMHRIGCVRGKGIVDYAPKYYPAKAGSTPAPEPAPPPQPTPPPIEIPPNAPDEPPQPLHSLDALFTQALESPQAAHQGDSLAPIGPDASDSPAPPVVDPEPPEPDPEPVPEPTFDPTPKPIEAPPPLPQVANFPAQVELPNGMGKTPRPMTNLYDAPPEEGIPLLTVSGPRCRYPMWSDMSNLPIEKKNVCGHPTITGTGGPTSWCEKHFHLVFEPPRKR